MMCDAESPDGWLCLRRNHPGNDRHAFGSPSIPTTAPGPFLTPEEQAAIATAGDLAGQLSRIAGHGRTRDADLSDLCGHVHAIQNAILAQAAARAYPGMYRLMGESLR